LTENLNKIHLDCENISNDCAIAMLESCPNLSTLKLAFCENLLDSFIIKMASNYFKWKEIKIAKA